MLLVQLNLSVAAIKCATTKYALHWSDLLGSFLPLRKMIQHFAAHLDTSNCCVMLLDTECKATIKHQLLAYTTRLFMLYSRTSLTAVQGFQNIATKQRNVVKFDEGCMDLG